MSRLIADRTILQSLGYCALCFFRTHAYILFVSGFPCASVRSIGVYRSAWRGFAICRLRQLLLLRASPLPLPFFREAPLSRDSDYILATSCVPSTLPCRVHTTLRFTGEQKARQRATWGNFAWTIAIITMWQNKFVWIPNFKDASDLPKVSQPFRSKREGNVK